MVGLYCLCQDVCILLTLRRRITGKLIRPKVKEDSRKRGPASTTPSGLTMTLPPAKNGDKKKTVNQRPGGRRSNPLTNHHIISISSIRVSYWMIGRIILFLSKLTSRKDKTTSFKGDMHHRVLPDWARVDSRSTVYLSALGVIIGSYYQGDEHPFSFNLLTDVQRGM